jgi:hypothetical protein
VGCVPKGPQGLTCWEPGPQWQRVGSDRTFKRQGLMRSCKTELLLPVSHVLHEARCHEPAHALDGQNSGPNKPLFFIKPPAPGISL